MPKLVFLTRCFPTMVLPSRSSLSALYTKPIASTLRYFYLSVRNVMSVFQGSFPLVLIFLLCRASKRLKAARNCSKETETPSPRESHPGQPSSSESYTDTEGDDDDIESEEDEASTGDSADSESTSSEEDDPGPKFQSHSRYQHKLKLLPPDLSPAMPRVRHKFLTCNLEVDDYGE